MEPRRYVIPLYATVLSGMSGRSPHLEKKNSPSPLGEGVRGVGQQWLPMM